MLLDYIFFTNPGLKRTLNEDYVNVFQLEGGLLAIVCDGLGGNKAGNIASELAGEAIYNFFISSQAEDNLEKINSAIHGANEVLIKASDENALYKGMATTIELLYIDDNKAYWGHVGDSRIYLYVGDELMQLTKDHSLVQRLVDDGYITEEDAERHPNRNVIMRALGDKDQLVVDYNYLFLKENESWKFLMCSDGVSGVLSKEEIKTFLSKDNLQAISKNISDEIEMRGAPDNFSFVIISNKI